MKAKPQVLSEPCLHLTNGELVSMRDVEFINIEEDEQGYDLITFKHNGEELKSRIIAIPI
jgi:hypothetical protein